MAWARHLLPPGNRCSMEESHGNPWFQLEPWETPRWNCHNLLPCHKVYINQVSTPNWGQHMFVVMSWGVWQRPGTRSYGRWWSSPHFCLLTYCWKPWCRQVQGKFEAQHVADEPNVEVVHMYVCLTTSQVSEKIGLDHAPLHGEQVRHSCLSHFKRLVTKKRGSCFGEDNERGWLFFEPCRNDVFTIFWLSFQGMSAPLIVTRRSFES